MPGEMTIELKGIRFFAYHGLYAEERKTGNEFEVNLLVTHMPPDATITHLSETVNYVRLYELLKTEMQKPRELLETFLMEFTEVIHISFPRIRKVEILITKLQPPILGFTGKVGVKWVKEW
jgi:7,8-dihydroneopterin aldolase/epimerase/oxygenase